MSARAAGKLLQEPLGSGAGSQASNRGSADKQQTSSKDGLPLTQGQLHLPAAAERARYGITNNQGSADKQLGSTSCGTHPGPASSSSRR